MAGVYYEDESTDDEFSNELRLAERLRINRGESSNFVDDKKFENIKDYKQHCNMRRKKFAQEGQSSSSSSIEMPNGNPTSGLSSSDNYHNKKRQNGDKNTEQLANPKRTCLSDRFRRSPDWRDLKKKAGNHDSQSETSIFPESLYMQSVASPDIFSDKKSDKEHGNNLADAEDSDFDLPMKINRKTKFDGTQNLKTSKNQSISEAQVQCFENKPSTSFYKLLDSGSEDDSKPVMSNGALKGGRQETTSDNSYHKKLFNGRKACKKLLDSDESEDDNPMAKYRSRPLVFSSSDDSDDFRQSGTKSKHIGVASNSLTDHTHSYGDGLDESDGPHSKQFKPFRSNQKFSKKAFCAMSSNRANSSEACERQFLSSDFQGKNIPHRPCKTRRSARINMPSNLTSNGFNGSSNVSCPVRGRRISSGERGSRRSGSPHHRSNRQHKTDDGKCRGRSASSSRPQKEKHSYASLYPDLFDAEDSDNEFFTANSYSDTETSTESLCGVSAERNFSNHIGSVSCTIKNNDRLFVDASSDDEVKVLYASPPYGRNNESRRGTSRTLGRRHSRGTPHRQLQNAREIVSLSPDPVEQVRQMEEDERMAIMLQAQFDAEVDPDYNAPNYSPGVNRTIVENDDTDDELIDPLGDSDSDEPSVHRVNTFPLFHVNHRGFRMNRYSSNRSPQTPTNAIFLGSRRTDNRSRRRPRYQTSWDNADQLSRLFEFSRPHMDHFAAFSLATNFLDDYETLLGLDLDDEAVPRGLSKGEINRLPTRKYIHPSSASSSSGSEVTHKRTELNKECQVCLSDYEMGDVLRILPCFHEFHTPCIDPWLTINHTCPVCRVTVDLEADTVI